MAARTPEAYRSPELWGPETGEAFEPSYDRVFDNVRVRLALKAHQAVFLVCRNGERDLPAFPYPGRETEALVVAVPGKSRFQKGQVRRRH
ncbi:MAG: hypothetical protein GY851_30515 [bacterium]|nr:hypothetical protein [bacterium]